MKLEERLSKLTWWIIIILFFVTVTQFSTWGYDATLYLLSLLFHVETESTVFQFLTGVIAMISSVFVFTGAAYAWTLRKSSSLILVIGGMGFVAKNILDISHRIASASAQGVETADQIRTLAGEIGGELFQAIFWVFVIVWFTRQAFKQTMIK